jgi:hypothetical protein
MAGPMVFATPGTQNVIVSNNRFEIFQPSLVAWKKEKRDGVVDV